LIKKINNKSQNKKDEVLVIKPIAYFFYPKNSLLILNKNIYKYKKCKKRKGIQ